jgi:hypothetical protein
MVPSKLCSDRYSLLKTRRMRLWTREVSIHHDLLHDTPSVEYTDLMTADYRK